MKATLKFDLEDIDDRMSHMRCVKSLDMAIVVFEITYNLRKTTEARMGDDLSIEQTKTLDLVFDEIMDIIEDRSIYINELTQ